MPLSLDLHPPFTASSARLLLPRPVGRLHTRSSNQASLASSSSRNRRPSHSSGPKAPTLGLTNGTTADLSACVSPSLSSSRRPTSDSPFYPTVPDRGRLSYKTRHSLLSLVGSFSPTPLSVSPPLQYLNDP